MVELVRTIARPRGVAAATAMVCLYIAAPALGVTTFTVTATGDAPGATCAGTVCQSLRAAVTAADASPGSTVQLGAVVYL